MRSAWKLGIAGLLGCLLSLLPAAAGAADWYLCKVKQAGPLAKSAVRLQLSDTAATPAFTDGSFNALSAQRKEMLAVALTAVTLDYLVNAQIDLRTSTILGLYVVAP
jgi:hypothetical protein